MKPWIRKLLFLGLGYAGFVIMLLFLENTLVYHPSSTLVPPPANERIDDVELTSANGTRIHAWYAAHPTSDQAILYCHGNAGNLSHRGTSIIKLRSVLNASVLIFDYPGYGKSGGAPSEQGCYQAADAAYAWLTETKKFTPTRVTLYGGSLGGGVAVDLASRKDHRALVLVKTFTTLPDTGRSIYWWMPVPINAVMRNRFDSLSKIDKCKRPVFMAHGTDDEVIPFKLGEQLFAAANEPKQFMSIPGNRHNDSLPGGFFTQLKTFLDRHSVDSSEPALAR
jgi:fermentation-respiration switch protein FrsA (DUF1100 family)